MMEAEYSLAKIAILERIPEEVQSVIANRCSWRRCEGGAPIVEHLDETRDVFFLVEGEARAVLYSPMGKVVSYRDLKAGSTFGELAAIDGGPRSLSVEAVGPCLLAVLSEQAFWEAIAQHSEFAKAVLKHLAQYTRDLTDRIYEFSTLAVNKRLHAELFRLAGGDLGRREVDIISPFPTHRELANRLSTHREAVSRELSRLADSGVIKREGKSLRITDMERLSRMVRQEVAD